ncbi:zinc carboxypeptidase domain-containing protein [Phthorimaea operculella]|nr:zinc carboxypeptidase domain-containing protein [Phthorimaea operculella]
MKIYVFVTIFVLVEIRINEAAICGCKILRPCYQKMIDNLKDKDEVACVEDSSIGSSTVTIYLKAIQQFCGEFIKVSDDMLTYEGRRLYTTELNIPMKDDKHEEEKPLLFVDAGQEADVESVEMALFLIEQLVGCEEHTEMLTKVRWVILPSVNPDGMEYARYNRVTWKKNLRPSEDGLSIGVDVSRNFDFQWGACTTESDSGFSPSYAGLSAGSENETIFVKNAIADYKKNMKMYVSIRGEGHGILYPYAYTHKSASNSTLVKIAAMVADKVNQRAGGVQFFANESIYEGDGFTTCGHSVDYAYHMGIPFTYELEVFYGDERKILNRFQKLPHGHEVNLRLGYMSGFRELYNHVIYDRKAHYIAPFI